MKTLHTISLALLVLLSTSFPSGAQQQPAANQAASAKHTFIVIYKPGPGWLPGKSLKEQPLQEHGKYILGLYSKGLLKFGGPFADGTGGAAVFEAADESEAKTIVAKDPAVISQIFVGDLHPWALAQFDQLLKK